MCALPGVLALRVLGLLDRVMKRRDLRGQRRDANYC